MATKVPGLDRYMARLSKIPDAVQAAVQEQLEKEADDMVAAFQRGAEAVSAAGGARQFEGGGSASLRSRTRAAGQKLSEGIEKRSGRAPLKVTIVAAAKDAMGRAFTSFVEYGHASNGKQVPPHPFIWPTYRARKRPMKRRLAAAARKAIKGLS